MKKSLQIIAWATLIALIAMTSLPCMAADSAVLRNGFSIRHERRQVIGAITRLFVGGDNSSFVDIPTIEIDHFETAPDEPHLPLQSSTLQASALQSSTLQASDKSLVHPPGLNKVDLN